MRLVLLIMVMAVSVLSPTALLAAAQGEGGKGPQRAPGFELPEPGGETWSYQRVAEGKKGVLVMFICNHCPFVVKVRDELARIGREYPEKGIGIVAINANDPEDFPADSPEMMIEEKKTVGYTFPYLFDASQSTARAYGAVCTPDLFLFDGDQKLFYRGQLDEARPFNDLPVNGADLRNALDALLAGKPAPTVQKSSQGCSIKWKTEK